LNRSLSKSAADSNRAARVSERFPEGAKLSRRAERLTDAKKFPELKWDN
jgi:hypothetical protein